MAQTTNNFIMLPTVDFCFKELMQNEKVRKGFIAALLGRKPEEIQETTLLPTILPAEYDDDKLGVLDVAVLLRDGTQIDMEMQVVYFPYWTNRVLFYLCRMYAGQLKKGDSYNKLKKCIHVSLLDFVHFPEDKKCYHKISLCDTKTGKLYTDLMELHILELRKLPRKARNEDSITRWMRFFNGKTREDFKEMAESDKYIHEAFSELEKLSADERKRLEYEAREKAVRDYNCLMDSAQELGLEQGLAQGLEQGLQQGIKQGLEQGLAQGLEQGLAQGLEQGLAQGLEQGMEQGLRQKAKEYTQKMLRRGMSPDEIADMLGEDPQMIASIVDDLQQEPQNPQKN